MKDEMKRQKKEEEGKNCVSIQRIRGKNSKQ